MRFGVCQRRADGRIKVSERADISRQALSLFLKAKADTCGPSDIGAAVHIVADPCRKPPGQGLECLPAIGPVLRGNLEQHPHHRIARNACTAHRGNGFVMFAGQRDWRAIGFHQAQCGRGCIPGACRLGNRVALRRRQQESRVAGENGMEQRLPPACAIALETEHCRRRVGNLAQSFQIVIEQNRGEQTPDPLRPALKRLAIEIADQPPNGAQRKRPAFQFA